MSIDTPPSPDRFAGLAKSKERLTALAAGRSDRTDPSVVASTDRDTKAMVGHGAVHTGSSLVRSAPIKPRPAQRPVEKSSTPPAAPAGRLGFQALKLAQQRAAGHSEGQVGEPSGAQSTSPKALDGETLANVAVEAKFNAVCKLFDAVSGYYKATPHEIQAEKAFFASLAVEDLDAVAEAYEAVASHVGIMTSDYQAQRAALETSRQLKDFYGKHGTSEDQIEHEAQASAAPRAKPKASRPR